MSCIYQNPYLYAAVNTALIHSKIKLRTVDETQPCLKYNLPDYQIFNLFFPERDFFFSLLCVSYAKACDAENRQKQFTVEIYVRRGIGMGPYGKGLALQNESSARAVAMALQY